MPALAPPGPSHGPPLSSVTDEMVDRYLPPYNKMGDEFPAYSSHSLRREEIKDYGRCISRFANLNSSGDASSPDCEPLSHVHLLPYRHATGVSFLSGIMNDIAETDMAAILAALDISDDDRHITRMLCAGRTLQEVATEYGTNRQNIHRRKQRIKDALVLYFNSDAYYALREIQQQDTFREVYTALAHGHTK